LCVQLTPDLSAIAKLLAETEREVCLNQIYPQIILGGF